MPKNKPQRLEPGVAVERSAAAAEELPAPDPPRPRKWLLAASVMLWIAWLGFLLWMALTERG
jgi:hypothetical protein